jgi:hypothetical protein
MAVALAAALWAAPVNARPSSLDDMDQISIQRLVLEEAANSTVPPALALAVARVESNFNARALSSAGARGVMQIMPATGQGEYGVAPDELWDARLNVQLGIDFLGRLIQRYDGRWDLALSHYNGGTISGTGADAQPLPATRGYVKEVMRWYKFYDAQQRVWQVAARPAPRPDGWQPARTAVDLDDVSSTLPPRPAEAEPVSNPLPLPQTAQEEAAQPPATVERYVFRHPAPWRLPHNPRTVVVWRAPAGATDDFADIEVRRQRARHTLDDFGPRPRPIRW